MGDLGVWEDMIERSGIKLGMTKIRNAVLLAPLLIATGMVPGFGTAGYAQRNNNNSAYYNGVRQGGRGGNYYNDRDRHYHDDHYRDNQGGIGPGKGALIGAGGGAVLGAVFGGGLKGTIIGGAAGAGIGAVVGQAAQNNRDNRYNRY
jgi:hypothetical protein